MKIRSSISVLALFAILGVTGLHAEEPELVKEALQYFPNQTVRLEYSSTTKLRKLPNYTSLRQRYLGPQLRKLEQSLLKLGIQESDVDELVLGWSAGAAELDLYGLARGHFDGKAVAQQAASAGVAPELVDDLSAYCLSADAASTCVVVLSNSLGAFGSLKTLGSMLDAQSGTGAALGPDSRLSALASEFGSDAPIWGVAVGSAISDWFKNFMPGQDSLQLDWSQVFSGVDALSYGVDAAEQVRLDLKLDCKTPEAAGNLRQLLDGLRKFQQLAWPSQHPNQPNPFQGVEVDSAGQTVNLKLTSPLPAA